jgi:two-component system, cell cycle response regulator DivK
MSEPGLVYPLWDEANERSRRAAARDRSELASIPGGRSTNSEPRPHRSGRVLIVDDNPDARDMYAMYFRKLGYEALVAHDGVTGIALATDLRPDVIVMDLAMPGMSGISATHHLKGNPRTRSIKVILLTGHGARAIQEGALEMGVDVFLTKPCLPEDLEGHVRRLILERWK